MEYKFYVYEKNGVQVLRCIHLSTNKKVDESLPKNFVINEKNTKPIRQRMMYNLAKQLK